MNLKKIAPLLCMLALGIQAAPARADVVGDVFQAVNTSLISIEDTVSTIVSLL